MGLFYGKKNLKHCSVTTGKPAPLFLLILKTQWESFICVCVCVCVWGGGGGTCLQSHSKGFEVPGDPKCLLWRLELREKY